MKTSYKLIIAGIILFLNISCSSNDDPTEDTNNQGTLTAKVNDTNFNSLEGTVGAVINSGVLALQGSNATGTYIRINIVNYNGTGTYKAGNIVSNTNSMLYGTVNPVKAWATTFNFGSGSISITEDTSTHIKGTFSFNGYEAESKTTKKITEGTFNAPKK